ncbi:hypothetical protein AVEN_196720-1 [Araneus ventricosus]|uniref:Uncharacterized protein n=1 Tax=Araneus ventricosus TaxID=182803 RepID=A0A4Y2NJN0_ARAVE|nr:hypothetical protein AVEN_196720-1 [Araneus ventricosus]
MESRVPAMLVLWLEREFYIGKYGETGSSQAPTGNLNLANILSSWLQIWRRNMGSQRCRNFLDIPFRRGDTLECTRRFRVTSRPSGEDYIKSALGSRSE